ncbi:hypothetical protein EJB05_37698, partial [Eragrostis curvula]
TQAHTSTVWPAASRSGTGRGGSALSACVAFTQGDLCSASNRRAASPPPRLYKPPDPPVPPPLRFAHLRRRSRSHLLLRRKLIPMAAETCAPRPLFGGAISTTFPVRFQDVSNIREVPDHQEVFVDPARDESIIVELLDLKGEVDDAGSALWFLRDIANEQDAGDNMVVEHSGTLELARLNVDGAPVVAGTAVGQLKVFGVFRSAVYLLHITKNKLFQKGGRAGKHRTSSDFYLANIRLKNAATDVVITAYEPLLIK